LYEMLAGQSPFEAATTADTMAAILEKEPPPLARFRPGVPERLEQILAKALRKNREERYQAITDLLIDLNDLNAKPAEIKSRKLVVNSALALLIAAIVTVVYFRSFSESGQSIDSVAVLPFVNVGANSDAEYLSDGITDSLINSLSQLPQLKVMSRNSVFKY